MRVLVACEFSGVVRRAFRALGHDAWSLDLLPAEDNDLHHLYDYDLSIGLKFDDLFQRQPWDMMIAFPPCTHLAVSGARWFKDKRYEQAAAVDFVRMLSNAPIPHIAIENPIGVLSTQWRKPDQIIQPWWFGHGETKATCLWLKGLPLLVATDVVSGRVARVHRESPGPDRRKNRSRTLQGVAEAMATQWGNL